MGRRAVPAVLVLTWGCLPPLPPQDSFEPCIVEWHASEEASGFGLNSEDVEVWADGRIQTSTGKRIVLSSTEMDRLFVLLSDVDFLQCDVLDERLRTHPGVLWPPDVVRDVILVYSPRPGLRRVLRRSWWDGAPEGNVFTPECSVRLRSVDAFFRELLAKQ